MRITELYTAVLVSGIRRNESFDPNVAYRELWRTVTAKIVVAQLEVVGDERIGAHGHNYLHLTPTCWAWLPS